MDGNVKANSKRISNAGVATEKWVGSPLNACIKIGLRIDLKQGEPI
jgi:hypothetical protein